MGRGPAVKLDDQGRKRCPKCDAPKKLEEFGGDTEAGWWRTSWCKTCLNKRRRERYDLPTAQRYHRKRTYGVDDDTYQLMAFMQGGVCAVCGHAQNSEYTQALFIDHNHETGQVRELLCHKCNYLLGFIEKDRERVKQLVKYLKKHDS